jgi:predicted nuclease of predicted toxin-antitoxin system
VSATVYVDHNVPREITDGLRRRGVDCLTAAEDSASDADDEPLFFRATALGRIFLTMDDDLIKIASRWLASGRSFKTVVYGHQLNVSIGRVVDDVELLAKAGIDEELSNRIIWLPL